MLVSAASTAGLREVNANVVLQEEPAIEIINSEDEWCYWYHNLIIGKLYKVIVSEGCMEKCLRTCLDEVIVTQDNLHSYDGMTDIAFLGTKKDITKIRAMHKNKEQHYGN